MDRTNVAIFEEVYNAHIKEIFRFSHLKVGERQTAEDIAANTFLKFWQRMSSGELVKNPRALLYFIARSLIIDHYRMQARRMNTNIDFLEEADMHLIDSYDLVESLDSKYAYETVMQAMPRLKESYQEIILLHYVEGLSMTEVSEILEETENNSRVRLHRALTELRVQFNNQYEKN
jgi:RNA polymerase sigma-70 factor (ECF subfamily)